MWTMPSTVSKRAARPSRRRAAARPSRSVPGPRKRSASKRRSSRAADAREQHFGALAPGRDRVRLVEPADVQDLLAQPCPRVLGGSRSGCTSSAHARVGHGTAVQLVVRSLTTRPVSLTIGSWSRPARAGSRSLEQPGERRPGQPDARAQRWRPSSSTRSPYHERDEVERVFRGVLDRARLTWRSKYETSTNCAPWR